MNSYTFTVTSTARGVLLADEQGAEVVSWFGSIGRSMQTLFSIQTLSGWDPLAGIVAVAMLQEFQEEDICNQNWGRNMFIFKVGYSTCRYL